MKSLKSLFLVAMTFCQFRAYASAPEANIKATREVFRAFAQHERPNWALRTSPLAAFYASWYGLDLAYRFHPHWSTGPTGIVYNASEASRGMFFPARRGYAVGWQATYYLPSLGKFKSTSKETFYIGLHSYFEEWRAFPGESLIDHEDIKGVRIDLAPGYMVTLGRFEIMGGAGLEYRYYRVSQFTDDSPPERFDESQVAPFFELKFGIEI